MGDKKGALQLLGTALSTNPRDYGAHFDLALLDAKDKRWLEAEESYTLAIRRGNAHAHFDRGLIRIRHLAPRMKKDHQQRKYFTKGLADFDEAIKRERTHFRLPTAGRSEAPPRPLHGRDPRQHARAGSVAEEGAPRLP